MATAGKAVGAGEEPPPRDLEEAFGHPQRGELWREAALEEFEGQIEKWGKFVQNWQK